MYYQEGKNQEIFLKNNYTKKYICHPNSSWELLEQI